MPIISGGVGGAAFNGGTITHALTIADPVTTDVQLLIQGPPAFASDLIEVWNSLTHGFLVDQTGKATVITDDDTTALVLTVNNGSSHADAFQVTNNLGVPLAAIKDAGALSTRQHAAPADGNLQAGECAVWFDQTNGAAKLMVKAKQADGTVRTAAVALA